MEATFFRCIMVVLVAVWILWNMEYGSELRVAAKAYGFNPQGGAK